MGTDDVDRRIGSVAALAEPTRRALYRYVVSQPAPVSREEAAAAVGVAHHVAKFNLDRLEAEGLLDVEYARPPGRRGPGAGRPAKRYTRAARDVEVSVPARRYDLAGQVMAEAITTSEATGSPVSDTLRSAARRAGAELGAAARERAGPRHGRAKVAQAVRDVLDDCGYEPRAEGATTTLANCPFHRLARDYPAMVCGMNLELLGGLLDAAGATGLAARLEPAPDRCCVTIGTH